MSAHPPQAESSAVEGRPLIGVLALQGDFREHRQTLERLGALVREVRLPDDLADVDALVIPGGESTAISKLLESSGLFDAISERLAGGMPAFGTCAGMILLAGEILDGTSDQRSFRAVDVVVRRNGIGPQAASFEGDLEVEGLDGRFPAVFIRPPVVEATADGVEVLADVDGQPVLCRQGSHLVASFHPEIAGDTRIHALFLEGLTRVQSARASNEPLER